MLSLMVMLMALRLMRACACCCQARDRLSCNHRLPRCCPWHCSWRHRGSHCRAAVAWKLPAQRAEEVQRRADLVGQLVVDSGLGCPLFDNRDHLLPLRLPLRRLSSRVSARSFALRLRLP